MRNWGSPADLQSSLGRRLTDGNNVQRIYRVGNAILVNDHNYLGIDGDKVLMRHVEFSSVRKANRERVETVAQAEFDLFNEHAVKLTPNHTALNIVFAAQALHWWTLPLAID